MDVDMDGSIRDDYYRCKYCNCLLPKQHFNLTDHTCFADIDFTKENIYMDETDVIFKAPIEKDKNDSVEKTKKNKNREDKLWNTYDEILIEGVRIRPCLWNYTIPVKKRGSLSVKEAWLEISKELKDNKLKNSKSEETEELTRFNKSINISENEDISKKKENISILKENSNVGKDITIKNRNDEEEVIQFVSDEILETIYSSKIQLLKLLVILMR